ncbi:internalin, putative [Streptomyces formicae]|uniref:Internalin, putative n=1 Tax=Streptomyces formicae TaxID=1616117 RepID=A0A291QGE2_9ACTN|nr:internalin, putative [Streptomyces formicae]
MALWGCQIDIIRRVKVVPRSRLRGSSPPLRKLLAQLLALAVLASGLVLFGAGSAAADSWAVEGEENPSTFDCDHLYYSNYRSGMEFANDASGDATIKNTVITKRKTANPVDYWSTSMAMGKDPDDASRTAAIYQDFNTNKIYKHVSGTNTVTDEIVGGATRTAPSGYTWGGITVNPANGMLYGAQNGGTAKNFFAMDLATGTITNYTNIADWAPAGTPWRGGTLVPDMFVDNSGGVYVGVFSGSNTYLYRIDFAARKVELVTKITGAGTGNGFNNYGMAYFHGSVYLGYYNGNLYKVNPKTGVSVEVGGLAQNNQTGRITSEGGGSWAITDLASCAVAPDLTSNIEIEKSADKKTAKPGDTVTYTVTVKNTGDGAATGVEVKDDLSGVVDDATYNDDAVARTGGGRAVTQPTYSAATKKLNWRGDIAAGATVTLTYSVTVGKPPKGDKKLTNSAVSEKSNCGEDTADAACSSEVPVALLDIKKTASPAKAKPGDKVTYTITVRNLGEADWKDAAVTDDLTDVVDDARYNLDGKATKADGSRAPGSVSYSSADKKLRYVGTVAKGATITITYTVTVGDPPPGNKKLTNTVVGPDGSNCAAGSKDPDCGTVTPVGGLVIKKTSSKADAKPGDKVTYTLTAENVGGAEAKDVTLTDDLTGVVDDATYGDDAVARTDGTNTATQPSYATATKKLTWTGDIAAGKKVTITYTVTVGKPPKGDKKLTNAVVGPDDSTCPAGGTKADCGTSTPVGVLEIKKSVSRSEAKPGDRVTYTVTVENTGEAAYEGASFTDDLSGVLDDATWDDVVTRTAGSTAFDADGKTFTWSGDVAKGAKVTVTYRVTVGKPPRGDKKLTNAVTGPEGSNCPAKSTDPDCAKTTEIRSLKIKKTASPKIPRTGGKVTYTVTVENTGTVDYDGATFTDDLTDVLDDATWDDSATANPGTTAYDATAKTLTWTGDLAVGAKATVTYTVTVTNAGDKYLRNVVTGDTSGNCPPDSKDPDCRTVLPEPGLEIKKTSSAKKAEPGDVITYTVTVHNKKSTAYKDATFTDDLTGVLDDATWNDAVTKTSGTTDYDAAKKAFTWTGDVAGGATVTVTYKVTVGKPPKGDKKLKNVVVGPDDSTCEKDSKNGDCSSETPVGVLEIKKTVSPAAAKPGQTVTYTVTVKNTGEADYEGAAFTDDLSGVLDDAAWDDDATATAGTTRFDEPGEKFHWNGKVAKGATVTVTYKVTVGKPPKGDKKLANAVVGPEGSTCPEGSTDPDCRKVTPLAQLEAEKTSSVKQVTKGQRVTYTVTIRNTGGGDYDGATLTDDLTGVLDDADWNDDATATTGTTDFDRPKLTWTGDVAKGATVTLTYSVTVHLKGDKKLTNTVVVPGSNCEKGSGDPDCETVVPPKPEPHGEPRLDITKTGAPSPATAGGTVGYTLVIRNTGTARYKGAKVSDDLGGVLDDASYNGDARASAGRVAFAAPRLTWTGDLAVGAVATVRYSVTVHDPLSGDKRLRNTVTGGDKSNCPLPMPARSSRAGRAPIDPDCSTDTRVRALKLHKSAEPAGKVKRGDTVVFVISATNTGTADYERASFTDDLANVLDDAAYNGDARADAGTVRRSGDSLEWSGPLAAGETATVTYSVTVRRDGKGDGKLRNAVVSTTPGGNCRTGEEPGCRVTPEVTPPVTPPPPPPVLPETGTDRLWALGAVAALLLGGAGLLLAARRRR